MNILNKIKDHPNQFLGFEILIFIWYFGCAFVYRFIGMHLSLASFIATLTMLIVMTAMGFIIPQKPLPKKIYLIAEFFILFLPYISKNFLNLPLLGVFVLLRAYQMFGIKIVRPSSIMLTLFILISTLFTKSFLTIVLNNNNDFMDNIVIIKSNYIFWLINIMLLINYMISNSESKKKLNVALDQLRKYSIQIEEQTRMLERNRIAYDIHDSLGHNLAAQGILIENIIQLTNMNNNDKVNNLLLKSKELCSKSLMDLRWAVSNIKHTDQHNVAIESSIKNMIIDFENTTGIICQYFLSIPVDSTVKISTVVYRILQEALTNISRYSQADQVNIQIFSKNSYLHILIQDNGKGFDPTKETSGFGLQSMKERTTSLNGQFNINSEPGKGCLITSRIPLEYAREFNPEEEASKYSQA
jgi:signal transduction histidine kinase